MSATYFHTQEKRPNRLSGPINCVRDNAWLGEAFYFWYSEDDAILWGIKSKKKTGYYEVYSANLDTSKVLNTVFNETHYLFWIKQIEKAAKIFVKKTNIKPTLKEINDYFKEKNIWTEFDGILFQDISENPDNYIVKEFQYKKRIQIAVYNSKIISNFVFKLDGQCV